MQGRGRRLDLSMKLFERLHASEGARHIAFAMRNSLEGLRVAYRDETAFRQVVLLSCVLAPLAFVVGRSFAETAVLAGVCAVSLITELLNTAVESAIDRISLERHPLSKKAKDCGSAAQFVAQLLILGVWSAVLVRNCFF